ncbi:MAG: GNAT family N-acetyltransferase [Roseinatronobacter sp.]
MNFDPAHLRWDPSLTDTAVAPSLRGRSLALSDIPAPPAEVWGDMRFRPWRENDAADYATLISDQSMWRFLPLIWPGAIDRAQAEHLITLTQDRSRHLVRAVIAGDRAVGQVRLHWQGSPRPMANAEIDYWLTPTAQGKGIGSRMVAIFLWQALRDYPQLQMVTIVIHRDNAPSRALARRLGFVETGPKEPGSPWIQGCLMRDAAARFDWGTLALKAACNKG